MKHWTLVWLLFTLVAAQDGKFSEGSLAGFTKSPTEHIINQIDEPLVVRSVNGLIEFDSANQEPLPRVLFEIRGPDGEKQIRQATTDRRGKFHVGHVPNGTYQFKATLNGFQSVVGTIVVTNKATKTKSINISMRIGD
ncbi:MAG TPA: carboxypeptidase-like regulatory domain-containing protein [Candidatus Angelobacter sp.]